MIGIVGLGRVGLAVALCLRRAGFDVIGYDKNTSLVESIEKCTLKTSEPGVEYLLNSPNGIALAKSLDELASADVIFIYVDTPNGTDMAYDHGNLCRVLGSLNLICDKQHVVICCTVMPGFIREVGNKIFDKSPLSYNPAFIAQGSIIANFQTPDIVLIGEATPEAGGALEDIYQQVITTGIIHRMSVESAEITKLALNCFVTMKIAYANMVADVADSTIGANKYAILNAIGDDDRIGNRCLVPGYGFGGPCFPRDNRAFGMYALQLGVTAHLSMATDASNDAHAKFMADNMTGDSFVFEDVAYKENVSIIENSQKLAVAKLLAERGKQVTIKDKPDIIQMVKEEFGDLFTYVN